MFRRGIEFNLVGFEACAGNSACHPDWKGTFPEVFPINFETMDPRPLATRQDSLHGVPVARYIASLISAADYGLHGLPLAPIRSTLESEDSDELIIKRLEIMRPVRVAQRIGEAVEQRWISTLDRTAAEADGLTVTRFAVSLEALLSA